MEKHQFELQQLFDSSSAILKEVTAMNKQFNAFHDALEHFSPRIKFWVETALANGISYVIVRYEGRQFYSIFAAANTTITINLPTYGTSYALNAGWNAVNLPEGTRIENPSGSDIKFLVRVSNIKMV